MLTKQLDVKEANGRLQEMLPQLASRAERVLTDKMKPIGTACTCIERVAGFVRRSNPNQSEFR
jgi:hypothetical protein